MKKKDVAVDDIPVANLDLPVSLKVSAGITKRPPSVLKSVVVWYIENMRKLIINYVECNFKIKFAQNWKADIMNEDAAQEHWPAIS